MPTKRRSSFPTPSLLSLGVVLSAAFVTINLTVDLLYACIDPRIRPGRA